MPTLLVVDDEPGILLAFRRAYRGSGLDVLTAEAPAEALALARLAHVPAVVAAEGEVDDRADAILGRCPAMLEVYKAIGRVAPQDVTALVEGETGTGKELVARAIYQHSRRAEKPFLAINCAAIPDALLESELFGHEKGA